MDKITNQTLINKNNFVFSNIINQKISAFDSRIIQYQKLAYDNNGTFMNNFFLPQEILFIVIQFLNIKDIFYLSITCRAMYYFMKSDHVMKYVEQIFESCSWIDKTSDWSFISKDPFYLIVNNEHEREPRIHYTDIAPLYFNYSSNNYSTDEFELNKCLSDNYFDNSTDIYSINKSIIISSNACMPLLRVLHKLDNLQIYEDFLFQMKNSLFNYKEIDDLESFDLESFDNVKKLRRFFRSATPFTYSHLYLYLKTGFYSYMKDNTLIIGIYIGNGCINNDYIDTILKKYSKYLKIYIEFDSILVKINIVYFQRYILCLTNLFEYIVNMHTNDNPCNIIKINTNNIYADNDDIMAVFNNINLASELISNTFDFILNNLVNDADYVNDIIITNKFDQNNQLFDMIYIDSPRAASEGFEDYYNDNGSDSDSYY